ncbi:MAG: radical SAM protein [Clostridia bacterium]|nr:radical SAM protein [Clostridia bacterium]
MKKSKNAREEGFVGVVNAMEKLLGNTWPPEAFDRLRTALGKEGKWTDFFCRLLDTRDTEFLKGILLSFGYEGALSGYRQSQKTGEKLDVPIPWVILFDPTSACNMHCTGCWAAEYGHQQSLTFEEMDRVLTEAKELGTHACLFTGGEPLMRKKDIIRLCEKHRDMAFHAFTNGTLIDDDFCKEMLRVGNFFVSVSIEGFEEANDGRRGQGHFQKALEAMDRMRSYRIPFGVSICYTSKNYKVVTSDEFLDMLIDKGCVFAWYFHYMPVGVNASTDLLLTPDQRTYMKNRIREIRGVTGGKEIYAIDFQNDGEFAGGCVAGGRIYCHINAAGDVEPCVFIHYSSANIREKSFLECLQQPLFKLYRKGQPFNNNHLRPCPMLENPDLLPRMVAESGAHSTDLEAPESAEALCAKCKAYADCWKPRAEELWQEDHEQAAE